MTKRSADKKLEAKIKYWDEALRPFDSWFRHFFKKDWPKIWWEIKNFMETVINFLWFPEVKTKGDKAYHLFKWWIAVLIGLRVLGLI